MSTRIVQQKMIYDDYSSNSIRDVRPSITCYNPSLWGDIFSTFTLDNQVQEMHAQEIEELKKDVRKMLMTATSSKLIVMVDTLERLGLAHQFEPEFEEKLEKVFEIYRTIMSKGRENTYDLNMTALAFRLLRQHQYQVSADCFDEFIDKETEEFRQDLVSDMEGLLSLYEAAHVRIHGEHILDEAVAFTTHHMTAVLAERSDNDVLQPSLVLKRKIKRALEQSLHRGVPIIEIRIFISVYESDESRDDVVLKLAKLNFNFMQNLYKEELCQLSRWWNKFDFKTTLPFTRDRLVECFLWGVAFHFEPKYSNVRKAVAKSTQMVSAMDDTYDNYGTLNENQLLTEALERWDPSDNIDELPENMKTLYRFIMSIYDDYVHDATKAGKSFAIPYFRETIKQLGRAYNQEQIWTMERRMPSLDEYVRNSVIRSCIYVMLSALVPGMNSVTEKDIEWLLSEPKLLIATAKIGRHLDDLGSHERENRDGKFLTAMDCFTKHYGVSKQEALSKFSEIVEDAWMNINAEWARKNSNVSKEFVEQLLNYARATEVTYKNGEDGYTNPEKNLVPYVPDLFIHPIPI